MRIRSLFDTENPTLSFEFFPPKTDQGRESLLRAIERLTCTSPDFVSVTYGAGGSTRSLSIDLCREIKSHIDGDAMAHLTCVCHDREEIAQIADQLWDSRIVNIMALRGDRPKDVDPHAIFGDFLHAQDLMQELKLRHDFCLGGACYPEGHKETPDIRQGIEHLKQKIDKGCEFLITQMFFNNDSYFRFIEMLKQSGIEVPVVPGIMPITGFSQIDKFENQFGVCLPNELRQQVIEVEGDEAAIEQIGIDWAVGQCRALLDGGAPGVHFYTLNRSSSTLKVCLKLGLTGSIRAGDNPTSASN